MSFASSRVRLFLLASSLASLAVRADAATLQEVQLDVAIYKDNNTAELVELARARHQGRALQIAGYRANTFTRVEGRMGASRFAPGLTIFAYETAARVYWAHPGNVKVDVRGARMAAPRIPGLSTRGQVSAFWEDIFGHEPWFVPGAIGDEIQLMGIPEQEALHPLARGAERFYHYAVQDSVELVLPNRTVRAVSVRVDPRVKNPRIDRVIPARNNSQISAFYHNLQRLMDSVVAANGDNRDVLMDIDWDFVVDSIRNSLTDSVVIGGRRSLVEVYEPTLVSGEMWLDAD